MWKDDGQNMILNPPGRPPLQEIGRLNLPKAVNNLVCQYVNKFLRSEDVLKKYTRIRGEIVSFYHNTSLELSKIENEWVYDRGSKVSVFDALETYPLFLPELKLPVIRVPRVSFCFENNHLDPIDDTYNMYLIRIQSFICSHLNFSYGRVITDLLDTVTKNMLPKRINYLKNILEQYQMTAQEKYLRKQKLERLARNVKILQETATELEESIENMTQVEEVHNGML